MASRKPKGTYDKCGAKNRRGEPCTRPAGWGTDHAGAGRCKLHGGCNPIKHGRYSKIARARLGSVLEDIEADPDPLNLLPEVQLIRAMVLKWVENSSDRLPPPMIADLLERAARIVDLIQKHKERRTISLETLNRVSEQMGVAVARHVKDPELLAAIERDWAAIQL